MIEATKLYMRFILWSDFNLHLNSIQCDDFFTASKILKNGGFNSSAVLRGEIPAVEKDKSASTFDEVLTALAPIIESCEIVEEKVGRYPSRYLKIGPLKLICNEYFPYLDFQVYNIVDNLDSKNCIELEPASIERSFVSTCTFKGSKPFVTLANSKSILVANDDIIMVDKINLRKVVVKIKGGK